MLNHKCLSVAFFTQKKRKEEVKLQLIIDKELFNAQLLTRGTVA